MGERLPRWLDHLTRNSVFDGDNVFLHMLERKLARESAQEGGSWRSSYFMPAQSDRWGAAPASLLLGHRKSSIKPVKLSGCMPHRSQGSSCRHQGFCHHFVKDFL